MKLFLNPFLQKRKSILFLQDSTCVQQTELLKEVDKNINSARPLPRTFMKLNLVVLLLGLGFSQVNASSYAQQITLKREKSNLETILKDLEKQSGYTFFYKKSDVSAVKSLDIDLKDISLDRALNKVLRSNNFSYDYFDKTIVIKKNQGLAKQIAHRPVLLTESVVTKEIQQNYIRGKVVDDAGKPLAGVTVSLNGSPKYAVATNEKGEYTLPISASNQEIVFSLIGFKTYTQKAIPSNDIQIIKLHAVQGELEEVIVTGTGINRSKDSFTGTTATFTGEELKSISNNNIIQSLRSLDPSFLQIENNLSGSNPNVMPVIEVRGKSSIPSSTLRDEFGSDPNQPLFVLDGFPTSIQTIMDLDMNRVASVTILKDAASTALYGSQASNGVVVIETVKPKPGELRFSYTQDFRFELPDLTAYNMMNASEKLEFERLAGRYITQPGNTQQEIYLKELYNDHLAKVQKGVDSYWLNEPVQYGYSTNNSINASGGDKAFTYNVGVNYRLGEGAMKGSTRDSYSGSINLTYRKNKINFNNITYIRGNKTNESHYGSFSTYVNTNPYFEKSFDNPYLEVSRQTNGVVLYVKNPLYDAMLPQYNRSKNLEVQNNFNANYDINQMLRLNAGLQLLKGVTEGQVYKSPEMHAFMDVPLLRKGTYLDRRNNNFSYQGNLMLTFYKTFAEKHNVTANWRNTISENRNDAYGTSAEGFPEGSLGNPRFAYSYELNGAPNASSNIYRSVNTTLSTNYAYDNRYLFDFVYRLDGSTAYGSNKQFSPYYAFGLGWNLHREQFVKSQSWINSLRLTGNIGITGNQNFANISSISVYNYNSNANFNHFGQGVGLSMLGNPDLEPQKTKQISTSLDFSLFNNRFSGYINAYNKETNPLIVPVDLPSSTGVFSYPYNLGSLTYQGVETKLTYFPIYNLKEGITWNINLTASSYKSKYDGFGNILETLNKTQEVNKSMVRYKDGNSAEAIWATNSMGIDPTTGREVFLRKDGQHTFDYSAANIENVGNTTPKVEGVIGTNLRYKGFSFGVGLRYRIGADIFNSALFNKVENISQSTIANNQDKRALYDRWQNPGDISQFKGISQTSTTPISSRFVQKSNTLSSETLNIGYLFDNAHWLKSVGLTSLSTNIMANDFMYFSTVRRERGIDYPYARTIAFSLKASF